MPFTIHRLISALLLTLCASAGALDSPRKIIELDSDWRFHAGDAPKAASTPGFDDSNWRTLDLPHDWAFEAGVSEDGAQRDSGGYYPGGIGWYRKSISHPDSSSDRKTTVEFDGVYMNSEVWVNGHHLGSFPYGYLTFSYDLTPHLKPGNNTIAVRCDSHLEPSARWFHPCGIYAPARLVITHPSHLSGVFVTTPSIRKASETVKVATETTKGTGTTISHRILSPSGDEVATSSTDTLTVPNPQRWDIDTPHLYTLVTRLFRHGKLLDEIQTRFGIRSIAWQADTGFWLNGRNTKLLGVCEHWEGGPVGGAWTPELMRWKLTTLKSMGCNAIRTAHNPCPPFFYDLCDELGILVMDEIFDGWKKKASHDYGRQAFERHWQKDLRTWLKRDRNHPSIIIWSLGNETGGPVAAKLVRICHELDPTRPVTSGHSGSEHMDVFGVNGHSEKQNFHTGNHRPKDKPFVATEAPHTWQVRGYYRSLTWFRDGFPNKRQSPFPLPDLTPTEIFHYDWTSPGNKTSHKQIFNSSYDNAMVRITARKNWELMRDLPWFSGHFRWTGFDYPGEAGYVHGGWPFRAFMGGSHDLAGFPKDLAHFYRSQWTTEPMVHLLPHWTHPKMKPGTEIPVWAYSNAEEVELLLDGVSLGIDHPGTSAYEMQCQWMVPWKPGTLTAIARSKGKEVARTSHITAGPPASFSLEPERHGKALILTTTLTDAAGVHTPYADNRIHYHPEGAIRHFSHENGNPIDTENGVTSTSRRAFMGKTRSFFETDPRNPSRITVAAILGSRNGVTEPDKEVTIHIHRDTYLSATRFGDPTNREWATRYTTDGSEPTRSSTAYTGPFTITLPTTIKALVLSRNQELFRMTEHFATDQGLYWSDGNQIPTALGDLGRQAEDASLTPGAKLKTKGQGFHGKGFVDLPQKNAGIRWYQENDGSAGSFTLRFRYAQEDPKGSRHADLIINGKKARSLKFPNTGSWDRDWKTLETTVRLDPGANDILLQATSGPGPSIDELLIVD